MEKLQTPIIPDLLEDYLGIVECPNFEEKMSFLQILQSVESPLFAPFQAPNFLPLKKIQALELESCITHHDTESFKPDRIKRKRKTPAKNKEELEIQRMTHIAVERNRRRQMNHHLSTLRSLMPHSYIQRADQASIIGGAIDFVKELEQLLQSLEYQKIMSMSPARGPAPPEEDELTAEIDVRVIQSHVNLKIQCPKKTGKLVKTIIALENLKLSILHLNITTSLNSVLYCFNLKIEDGLKMVSRNEIAAVVNEIFMQ